MDHDLERLVRDIVTGVLEADAPAASTKAAPVRTTTILPQRPLKAPADPLAIKVASWLGAPRYLAPATGEWRPQGDRAFYLSTTPARLGIGRVGTRYRTASVLTFLRDHATARDAVASVIDPEVIRSMALIPLPSAAHDKREFLLFPMRGRQLGPDAEAILRQKGVRSPQVQIVVADGLSATAINVNLPLILPALIQELQRAGVRIGTTFVVTNGRVAIGDPIAQALDAEVLCMLVGERPGLKTAESVGAYVTYSRVRDLNESMRYMISNIHKDGLVPEEGARQIAALCIKALREKRTGVDMTP